MALAAGSKGVNPPRPNQKQTIEQINFALGAGSKGVDPPRPTRIIKPTCA